MTATSRARHATPAAKRELRPDLTVVRRRRARRSMITRLGTVMLFSLFVSVFGVVVFQTLRVQNQAKLDEISARIAQEEDAAKVLRLKVADAQSPDRISEAARTRLGMIPPNDIAYLQPSADDEAKAAWDPQKEPIPVPPPPPDTAPTTVAPTSTVLAKSGSASSTGTGTTGSSAAKGKANTKAGAANVPSTATAGTATPTTTKPTAKKPPATTTTVPTVNRR